MNNKLVLISSLSIISILSAILFLNVNCGDLMLLTANTDIEAYEEAGSKNVKFIIPSGFTCSAGDQISKKVYAYRKVLCSLPDKNFNVGYIITTTSKRYTIVSEERELNY